ncbi:MAG: glycosyltransferase family 4 protein [Candidatus Hodarchaeota archaeon]
MSINKKNKIILITNIPTPYRIPLFNELREQLKRKGLGLKVVFGALGYARRKWAVDMSQCKFEYEVLPSKNLYFSDSEKSCFTYSGLYRVVSKENPSVIITNGFSIATLKLWLRSWFLRTPYIIWSGAIVTKGRPDSFLLRRIQRRIIIKRAVSFIAYGTKAKEYLISLGARADKIQIGINTTSTEFYKSETKRIHDNMKDGTKRKRLLYIGYITKRKRLDQLFHVVKSLSSRRQDFVLQLVGSGPEVKNLKNLADDLNVTNLVSFEGFKQKKEILSYLAAADCFLFPSEYDIWGLVLVEAMSAGLPCISSIYAGATHDLIQEGVTGFAMDFSKTEEVVDKVNWILENPELAKQIGQNASRFIAENVSIEKSAAGFVSAITSTLKCLGDARIK